MEPKSLGVHKPLGVVYRITCLANNKIYIGQTVVPLNRRWNGHVVYATARAGKSTLCEDIRKYGRKGFKVEPLVVCYNQAAMNVAEEEWISKTNRSLLYNHTAGGNNRKWFSRRPVEHMKRFLEAAHNAVRGRKQTDDEKRRRSESLLRYHRNKRQPGV